MSVRDIIAAIDSQMQKTLEKMRADFSTLRTGRANAGLLENLRVDYYGTLTPINQLANIAAPEGRTLEIKAWDKGALQAIEKAIQKSNLGLNPTVDKKSIRIVLPELSQERRVEFTKVVKKMAEDGRVAIRHVRRDAIEALKKSTKSGGVTEDQTEAAEKEVQKLTDQYIAKIEVHLTHKEKEIMTV